MAVRDRDAEQTVEKPRKRHRSDSMKKFDSQKILLDEGNLTDEQFEERNLLNILSVGIFLVGGPLFIYFGFYLLTSPLTVKWGSLSIAIGLLVLAFGFSLWQDRQVQTLRRVQMKENAKIKKLLENLLVTRK
jgi:hypothetical protein